MSGHKPLAIPADIIYTYDGSYFGFLCCVFDSVYNHELPVDIVAYDEQPITLYQLHFVETDEAKALRVLESIQNKISLRALSLIDNVFLSCAPQKELLMLKFLLRGYEEGGKLVNMLGDPDVAPLMKAQKHILGEAHLLLGFIRFADYNGSLAATITPKNFILPFIAEHFTRRYKDENFLIFDKTNKAALMHQDRRADIFSLDDIEFPEVSETEMHYQALWKQFYNTVSIEARENPRCRLTHMPKRYWQNMLEVSDN